MVNFAALLFSLFILRQLALDYGYGQIESTLAPSVFILAFPYIQTGGGYFYDSVELVFFSSAVLLASKGHWISLAILAVVATLNKESFFFIIPTLYPFLREKFSQNKTIVVLILAIIISGVVNVYIKSFFQESSGVPMQFHLLKNIKDYFRLGTYFQYETTYGLPSPRGFFITTIALMFIIVMRGWHEVAPIWKSHMLIATVINLPLFLVFCSSGELRNLLSLIHIFQLMVLDMLQNLPIWKIGVTM